MIKIRHTHSCETGGREENQDYCAMTATPNGAQVYAVADGLGGHSGGAIASHLAVDAVLAAARDHFTFSPDGLLELHGATQATLRERQKQATNLRQMRTTLVLLAIQEEQALWLHSGDSRLYHFRDCTVLSQTKDHSVPQMLAAAGDIKTREIRNHPDRNRVLRALGGTEDEAKATVRKAPVAIQSGDAFLLCTDGFWEWVLEDEMERTLCTHDDSGAWLTEMEKTLLSRAAGDFDNYTAFVVIISDD